MMGLIGDMQEDKEAVFDTADTVTATLAVMTGMLSGISVHRDAMRRAAEDGFITATDLADYLGEEGDAVPPGPRGGGTGGAPGA